jgi:putative ABC transport system ATP-binding protein
MAGPGSQCPSGDGCYNAARRGHRQSRHEIDRLRPHPTPVDGNRCTLLVANVTKVYLRGTPVAAITDVSLRVSQGERVAIMGPSGSGKSTLLNLIGGLDVPTAGSIRIGGVDLATMGESRRSLLRRSQVAYVFQAYHLLPTLTCEQNVGMPLYLQGVRHGDIRMRVSRVLADVGLGDRSGHLPDQLSGGERQRAAIARALVTDPSVLLADEPTGNLDSVSGEHILALLRHITEARQTTLVMVTHNDSAARICDRVVRLRDGRIEERRDA